MLNFIKHSNKFYLISSVAFISSILVISILGIRVGLDFTGGTMMELSFDKAISVDDARSTLSKIEKEINQDESNKIEISNAVIQVSGENNILIRSKYLEPSTHDAIISAFEENNGKVDELRYETVGPIVGESLKSKARIAVILAIVFMILYISYAFRKISTHISSWKFGFIAVTALIHDMVITIGTYTLFSYFFGAEMDLLFVTALLTVFGFSVHDTIVVFDRIRENLQISGRTRDLSDIANESLHQTISRSINTSMTTLIVLTLLAVLGAQSILYFVLTMIVGIVVGTYSSIFIAVPLLVTWVERRR